ncbi:MAG: hypothetical protein HYW79_01660 [Parcubacteria group bacterium]|nr:hypothetical protein [Parcubacteria group bacterium]
MEISFGDFVNYLVLLLQKNNIDLMLHKQEAWHHLFYRLKRSQKVPGKPDFLETLWFDWDGPYPKSPELSQCLSVLCWIGVVQTNSPKYDRYCLPKDTEKLWLEQFEKLDKVIKQYLHSVIEAAKEEFPKVFSQA